jgi:hypothetical protein
MRFQRAAIAALFGLPRHSFAASTQGTKVSRHSRDNNDADTAIPAGQLVLVDESLGAPPGAQMLNCVAITVHRKE